jgi:tetratricopeptide (TPR) repeat protein
MKALLLAELGDFSGAETTFQKTLALDPNQPRTWYNLGLLYAQKERLADAVKALKKAEEFDRESADYPYARATIHLRQGDKAAAQEAAQKALEITPNFTPAGTLLQSMGPLP